MTRPWLVKLTPRVDALLEQLRSQLESERGEHLEDEELFEAICVRALEPAPPSKGKVPKPMHRLVTHTCDGCLRGWRQGRGKLVELPAADVELAGCDAEIVAWVRAAEPDADQSAEPASDAVRKTRTKRRPRPTQTIPKVTRDFVWQRDQGRCRVPGCRATRNLACHHIRFRSQGGDHDPANLVLLCDGHHKLLHDGLLTITGRAPDQLTFTRNGQQLVDSRSATELAAADKLRAQATASFDARAKGSRVQPTQTNSDTNKRSRFGEVVKLEHAKQALMQLGFKARAARAALEDACAHVGADADIPTLVKAALDLSRRSERREDSSTDVRAEARQALVQLGYSSAVAAAAVQAACAHVGTSIELPLLLKEALRHCGGS